MVRSRLLESTARSIWNLCWRTRGVVSTERIADVAGAESEAEKLTLGCGNDKRAHQSDAAMAGARQKRVSLCLLGGLYIDWEETETPPSSNKRDREKATRHLRACQWNQLMGSFDMVYCAASRAGWRSRARSWPRKNGTTLSSRAERAVDAADYKASGHWAVLKYLEGAERLRGRRDKRWWNCMKRSADSACRTMTGGETGVTLIGVIMAGVLTFARLATDWAHWGPAGLFSHSRTWRILQRPTPKGLLRRGGEGAWLYYAVLVCSAHPRSDGLVPA
ncbi:hypothetical protein Tco_0460982 [Tanacetum coccineum]